MDKEIITAVCLGIGLSASCGFRVFVPLLIAGIFAKLNLLPLSEGFGWLGSWPAIFCFGAATVTEVIAYYVPFVDNLLDTIATPLAIGAGTLLSASVFPVDNDLLKWVLALIIGGGAAAVVQGGTSVSRLASTKFTAGTGNVVVASGENLAAVGTPLLTLLMPVLIAVMVIFLVAFFLRKIIRKFAGKYKPENKGSNFL